MRETRNVVIQSYVTENEINMWGDGICTAKESQQISFFDGIVEKLHEGCSESSIPGSERNFRRTFESFTRAFYNFRENFPQVPQNLLVGFSKISQNNSSSSQCHR